MDGVEDLKRQLQEAQEESSGIQLGIDLETGDLRTRLPVGDDAYYIMETDELILEFD